MWLAYKNVLNLNEFWLIWLRGSQPEYGAHQCALRLWPLGLQGPHQSLNLQGINH
jgi:hypothetical protein